MDVVGRGYAIDPFAFAEQDAAGLVRVGGLGLGQQAAQNVSRHQQIRSP